MPITYDETRKYFKLDTKNSTYIVRIFEEGYLVAPYYGPYIPEIPYDGYEERDWFSSFSPKNKKLEDLAFAVDVQPMEYSGTGVGDFRKTAVAIRNKDGNNCTDFRYASHRIYVGKPELTGLPSTFPKKEGDCVTLEITTRDSVTGAVAVLIYTVFENTSVITRSVRIENRSDKPFDIEKAYSASVSFNDMKFDMVHLYGTWNYERNLDITPIRHGQTSISSSRGSSSHYHSPAVALTRRGLDENVGEVFGFCLVYSGNFDITADCDYNETMRLNIGINPDGFLWHLAPGESFQTPEAVLVFSDEGLGGMSREYHRFFKKHLIPEKWQKKKRPLLINSWEAAYMNINTDVLVSFAERAKELGIEMLVMDDGWFGKRNDDTSSLGDWYVNEEKFPGGLGTLIEKVNSLGVKFGIWFEPEMISPVSRLFELHPDWHIHVPERESSVGRHQYVIDMSRKDVRDAVYEQIKSVLSKYNIEYLKWDFNRNLSEAGSALLSAEHGEEIMHRFVLGTYDVLSRLKRDFPELLVETCSGGGGRFDAGMLYYAPQIWTSDNTDPIQRIDIQFGTSLFFPASTMGAHVSMNRRTDFITKGNVAMWGTFGYELDPNKLTEEERKIVKTQVENYHKYHDLIRDGELYRIICPWSDAYHAGWEILSTDKREFLYTHVAMRFYRCMVIYVKFKGLSPDLVYTDTATGKKYTGQFLMNAGLNLTSYPRDTGESFTLHFVAE